MQKETEAKLREVAQELAQGNDNDKRTAGILYSLLGMNAVNDAAGLDRVMNVTHEIALSFVSVWKN